MSDLKIPDDLIQDYSLVCESLGKTLPDQDADRRVLGKFKEYIERIARAEEESNHLCTGRYLCDQLDKIKAVGEFATCTDDEFKEAMEYYDTCRCYVCEFARYVLSLRTKLADLELYRPELKPVLLDVANKPEVSSLLYDLDLLPEQLMSQKNMTRGLFAAYNRLEGVLLAFKFMEIQSTEGNGNETDNS